VVITEEEAEEKEEAVAEEVKAAEVETSMRMLDQEPELRDSERTDNQSSSPTRKKAADSKARREVNANSTDNPEPVEEPESHMRRRTELAKATGERSQIELTSKVSPRMLPMLKPQLRLRMPNQPRSRKRRPLSQKRKPSRSFSELAWTIS